MNLLDPNLQTGIIGELLVQIRLLQYDVQAVATHKDTGNDLLATKGEIFRAIQVKTTRTRGRQITVQVPPINDEEISRFGPREAIRRESTS